VEDVVAVVLIIVVVGDVIMWVIIAIIVVVLVVLVVPVVLVVTAIVMHRHIPGRVEHCLLFGVVGLFEVVRGLPLRPLDSAPHLMAVEIMIMMIKYS
jgi:hypothetical protein